MRVLIAGSRDIKNYKDVEEALALSGVSPKDIDEIISGCARGADKLGEKWADEHQIPVKKFPAEWEKYGKRAGYLRNVDMADYADVAVILWDGNSRGTRHTIQQMIARNKKVYVFTI